MNMIELNGRMVDIDCTSRHQKMGLYLELLGLLFMRVPPIILFLCYVVIWCFYGKSVDLLFFLGVTWMISNWILDLEWPKYAPKTLSQILEEEKEAEMKLLSAALKK